jgi:hypothetical protein
MVAGSLKRTIVAALLIIALCLTATTAAPDRKTLQKGTFILSLAVLSTLVSLLSARDRHNGLEHPQTKRPTLSNDRYGTIPLQQLRLDSTSVVLKWGYQHAQSLPQAKDTPTMPPHATQPRNPPPPAPR